MACLSSTRTVLDSMALIMAPEAIVWHFLFRSTKPATPSNRLSFPSLGTRYRGSCVAGWMLQVTVPMELKHVN